MCVVCCVSDTEGASVDGIDLALTLCKYDLRKGDFIVLSLARVQVSEAGSISSELPMCGGGVRSIPPLPPMARCPEQQMYAYGACLSSCMLQ